MTNEIAAPDTSNIVSAPAVPAIPSSSSPPVAHIAWTFVARVVMIFNSIAAGIIVAHWLGAEGVGHLAVINVTISTLIQLGSLGLPSANTYFIARDPQRFRSATVTSLLFTAIVGTVLAVLVTALVVWQPAWFGNLSPRLMRIAAISIPFQLATLIGLNILLAIGNVRDFNLLDLLGQSFVLINAVVALIILGAGLAQLVTMNTAISILVAVFVVAILSRSSKTISNNKWRLDAGLLRSLMTYGIKFHISIVAGALIFRADLLVVNHFRGAAEAGVYSVASQVGMMLMLLPGVIATLLFPRVTAEQDARGETTCVVARHTSAVMLACCLAAVPLSLLLPVLYGRAFADAPMQLIIMLPGIYLVGIQSVLVQHFNALGLPRAIPIFWILTLVINVALVLMLVPRFAARGAALASAISYTLIFVFVAVYFKRTTGRSLSDVLWIRGAELRQMFSIGSIRSLRRSLPS